MVCYLTVVDVTGDSGYGTGEGFRDKWIHNIPDTFSSKGIIMCDYIAF